MKTDTGTDVAAAMDALLQGYKEEAELYRHVRRLTWKQRDTLCEGWDLNQFHDLLDEKEDLLQMIGQVESEMRGAKALVLAHAPSQCPNRWQLERQLDRLTEIIEEIRIIEGSNVSLLSTIPAVG